MAGLTPPVGGVFFIRHTRHYAAEVLCANAQPPQACFLPRPGLLAVVTLLYFYPSVIQDQVDA